MKAGSFDTYVIGNIGRGLPTIVDSSDRWYAPEIGIVNIYGSRNGVWGDLGVHLEYHTELLSYHLGPRRR